MHGKVKQATKIILVEEDKLYKLSLCASPRTQKKMKVSVIISYIVVN